MIRGSRLSAIAVLEIEGGDGRKPPNVVQQAHRSRNGCLC